MWYSNYDMPQKIRKAVIPAAGLGTRFLPASKAIPKEMLPIVDKPVIHYVVEELVAAGIEQIIIVTGWHKRTIEDHFDYPFELEYRLLQAGKRALYESQREIADAAEYIFVRQREPLGTGHAILQAQSVVGDEPFLVHWGDDIIDAEIPAARQLMDVYEQYQSTVLAVQHVEPHEIVRYGSIDPEPISKRIFRVKDIIEKPVEGSAPSLLGQVCEFILTPDFFERMRRVQPGKGGERWHIDAIQEMARESAVYAHEFIGKRYDCGDKHGYMRANIDFALKRDDMGSALREYLKKSLCE